MIALFTALCFAVHVHADEVPARGDSGNAAQQADTVKQPQDINNPEYTLPTKEEQETRQTEYFGRKRDRAVGPYKVNYFAINQWPESGNSSEQIKFQLSLKFRVLKPNLYVLKYNLFPAYFAYTQKTLWNRGKTSKPVEESNYHPEFFLDYPVHYRILGRFNLRNIILSPLDHESNGLDSDSSRSWNRQYVQVRFNLEAKEKLEETNSMLAAKAAMSVKLWHASGYSGQDKFLAAKGKKDNFLDYMGDGEFMLSLRNFLWGGSLKDHQLDVRTPISLHKRKTSYEFEFRQQVPDFNFALYFQYWYGFGETLLRFDQFGRRGFIGLAFSY